MNPSTKTVFVKDPSTPATLILAVSFSFPLSNLWNTYAATTPIKIRGKTDISGFVKTIGAIRLVGAINALMKVMSPHMPPIMAPSFIPRTIAAIMTVT